MEIIHLARSDPWWVLQPITGQLVSPFMFLSCSDSYSRPANSIACMLWWGTSKFLVGPRIEDEYTETKLCKSTEGLSEGKCRISLDFTENFWCDADIECKFVRRFLYSEIWKNLEGADKASGSLKIHFGLTDALDYVNCLILGNCHQDLLCKILIRCGKSAPQDQCCIGYSWHIGRHHDPPWNWDLEFWQEQWIVVLTAGAITVCIDGTWQAAGNQKT